MGHARTGIVLTLAVCGIALASSAVADDEIDRVLAEHGKARYEQYWTSCHGPGGAPGAKAKTDLRHYVAAHGGKFPAHDWLAIIADTRPGSVHTEVWERIKASQDGSSTGDVGARAIVGQIARYVNSIQSK